MDNKNKEKELKIAALLKQMKLSEKIALCSGADFWHSREFPQYGIRAVTVADGPHGLRLQAGEGDMLGVHASVPATCFPASSLSACSWDEELAGSIGEAVGEEAAALGVAAVLGPGLNIKRNPLCGRNFEYYSEDPLLSGKLGAAFVKNVQSAGTGACLKHFAGNNQEYKRFSSDDHMDERTLREIYLPAFEIVVKEGMPSMVMCAYNKINGVYCSDSRELLTDILRGEWGFEGLVVTDWGAMHDRVKGFLAGCDWAMPGGKTVYQEREVLEALDAEELREEDIDLSAGRMLRFVMGACGADYKLTEAMITRHDRLAARAVRESAVLLKNQGILPLASEKVVLIGDMADHPRYQGSGSSHINPARLTSLRQAEPDWRFARGCDECGNTSEAMLEEAVKAARDADIAVVAAGLTDSFESEGYDRADMKMPEGHIRLIHAVAEANPNTVVVLLCGSPVEVPWADKVKGILYAGLCGQAGGEAIADLLAGRCVPEGKLAETWPVRYGDVPSAEYYGAPRRDAQYREGIYVGYRYYETARVPVMFPFGYGLSYTEFSYEDLTVENGRAACRIRNIGEREGAEIVQLYIGRPEGGIHRPALELKGFRKVRLKPGEVKDVEFILEDRSFAVWDGGWKVPEGSYKIMIGSSVRDIRLQGELFMAGSGTVKLPSWQTSSWYGHPWGKPPKEDWERMLGRKAAEPDPPRRGGFTMENTVEEMAEFSIPVRIMKASMVRVLAKMNGGRVDFHNPQFRMSYSSSVDCALFGMVQTSGDGLPEHIAQGLVLMANGHFLKGIARMLKVR